jgi:hypothetical protein
MQKWAFNILINASKKNARRRDRLFKYFSDIQVENGVVRFASTSTPTRVYDIEAQALTYTESHTGRIIYEDLNVDEQVDMYDPPREEDEYESIDWYM